MRDKRRGFTLIEVLISLAILALVMSAVSTFFLGSMQQFKVQSRIAQTGMDTLVGIELLRKDVEHAGYGLPWNNLPTYSEATSGILNDTAVPGTPPRGIVSVDGGGLNGSDYLVIKAVSIGISPAAGKWTTLQTGDVKRQWTTFALDNSYNLLSSDRVIVVSPGNSGTNWRSLVNTGGWWTTYNNTSAYAPGIPSDTRVIYGIDGPSAIGNPLRMPFNRADYYIATTNVPERCAPNTGVLMRAVVSQDSGALTDAQPLLDCVAGMQVQYDLDTTGDGVIDDPNENDISSKNAQEIRDEVKQVRITLLAHEGMFDKNYTHSTASYALGNAPALAVPPNYRWKVYTLTVTPQDLGG